VGFRLLRLGEPPGRLDHDIDLHVLPRKLARVGDREDGITATVDHQIAALCLDLLVVTPVDGVIFEEIGHVCNLSDVVNRDNFQLRSSGRDLERLAADSSEPVDCYTRGHRWSFPCILSYPVGAPRT